LRAAFVHEPIVLNTAKAMPQLQTIVVPHGPFPTTKGRLGREAMREKLHLSHDAKVLLAFGQIRDAKNLHLVIEAMRQLPDVYLVVAGQETFSRNKGAMYYKALAERLGVSDRCRWLIYFIPEEDISDIFSVADLVLLTYTKSFRSASGVLNTAVCQRKPCIASAGASNLRSSVLRYSLGLWVEPDDLHSLIQGLRMWLTSPPCPRWEEYESEHSWDTNARIVQSTLWGSTVIEAA
jgi:glycosyltransferase involved in cell wall biosynthesis